ncbi:hypothetical protein RRG08_014019 [Elysia crispata]|uniref:Endonuclease/exonuclease/phosphatase domain-containing protein n=1 Tax=Elysia crispata TaxID=231223 RepID=A0AAE0XEN1_9GAST|nr:hypothetical protein RRG08_014019 [Elysia crispata]
MKTVGQGRTRPCHRTQLGLKQQLQVLPITKPLSKNQLGHLNNKLTTVTSLHLYLEVRSSPYQSARTQPSCTQQLGLHHIRVPEPNCLVPGDLNSHSPAWGHNGLDAKGRRIRTDK